MEAFLCGAATMASDMGMGARAVERLKARAVWRPPTDGFAPIASDESDDFVAARLAAHRACAAQLDEHLRCACKELNDRPLGEITRFLHDATRRVQYAWSHDATPPYVELPAALVHTGCHSADLPLALQQLRRHLKVHCSPHVALLHSKECTSLLAATRSLTVQLIGATARTASGCTYDLDVLVGWHQARREGRVAARSRTLGGESPGAMQPPSTGSGTAPLIILFADAEHFPAEVLNDLIYSCASIRSREGLPLPLTFAFALNAGVEALHRLLYRSTLVLLHGKTFSLASTERSIDEIVSRVLRSAWLPQLSTVAYTSLLDALSEQHGSTTAFIWHLQRLLLRHFRSTALAFLIPIQPFTSPHGGSVAARQVREDVEGLVDSLQGPQLRALLGLPSVTSALKEDAASTSGDQHQLLRDKLPQWLTEVVHTRHCRAAALSCLQSLLELAFPGANRDVTAPRRLYMELLSSPVLKCKAVRLGLGKCRERGAMPLKTLRLLLARCERQLREAAHLLPAVSATGLDLDSAISELQALLNHTDSSPAIPPAAPSLAETHAVSLPAASGGNSNQYGAAKRRRTALASFVHHPALGAPSRAEHRRRLPHG